MLACTRIGAPHSVVFAGFSAESLRDRITDANCKVRMRCRRRLPDADRLDCLQWVFTSNEGLRGGRLLPLKAIADKAVEPAACVQKVFVFQRYAQR